MGYVGQTRYIDFRVLNGSTPVTNITLGSFVINPSPASTEETDEYSPTQNTIIFERNSAPCSDVISFHNFSDGRYAIMYTPSSMGHDYVDIWVAAESYRRIDEDDIESPSATAASNVAVLNQDYGSPGQYRVTLPKPNLYSLYVFLSSDWTLGKTKSYNALGNTPVMTNGDWVNSINVVTPNTVHIVLVNGNITVVLYPFVSVT
jgi:hypothetical protein